MNKIKNFYKSLKIKSQNLKNKGKKKSFLLGMVTVFSVFGFGTGLFGSSLSAIAKDLPVPGSDLVPTTCPSSPKHSDEITKAISGAAASVRAAAVASGSLLDKEFDL